MKFMRTFAILIFVQSALFLSACNMGLGDSVDVKGPTVTIVSPEARENVSAKFEIHGIVTDDFAVGTVTVELDGNTWRHTGSRWEYKAKGTDNFVSDAESEWIPESKKSVRWTIKDATISSGGGTFKIKVSAIDESGNSSAESTKTRDVVIDKNAPKITISSPTMFQESDLNPLLELEDYKDITKVTQFLTGDFTISGKTEEENTIKYVKVYITEDGMDDEEYLFEKMIVQSESDKTSESYEVVDSLRSWKIPVELDKCNLSTLDDDKHILKIFTSSGDTAGNDSGLTFQGYACLWKEADTPWIDIRLGTKGKPLSVYGSSVLGNAYDDTAIQSVNVTIKNDANGKIVCENKQIYPNKEGDEDENNVYFDIDLPSDSGVYCIEITATDKKGNSSETETGWVYVVDKTFPSIEISHTGGGNLFCDKDGNFTFNITSKDDTNVSSLKMAYITKADDTVEYANASSKLWDNTSEVYNITPIDTGKTVTDNGLKRKIYENKVTINIFDRLGIGIDESRRKLTNQTFVFRVEDNNKNALTSIYTIQGDIEPPKINFTKLEYYSYNGDKAIERPKEGGDALPAFGANTYVKVYGNITDNSSYLWGNEKARPTLDLKVNGKELKLNKLSYNDGTFEARADNLTGASLVFEGKVTDFGGNTETGKWSFLVDSQTPRVEYISALNADGFYKVDDTIDIFIRFNKKLTFSGTTSIKLNNGGTASMSSNPEKKKSIGENDILFEYKIGEGDKDIDLKKPLTVTGAMFTNVESGGAKVTDDIQKSIDDIIKNAGLGKNLGQMKNIGIITSVPKVTNIGFDETNNTLTITYDKAVAKGSGEVTIVQLKTVNGAYDDGVDKVPAVLTEAEGRTLFGKNSKLENYYDLTTNGALKDKDENFNADLTSKYVLKYEYNSDEDKIIEAYEATGAYKLSQDVRAQGVKIDGNKVTVEFNSPLPCKGATYKITVPAGFVQDKNGGSKFPAGRGDGSCTATGIEPPVIRIKKGATTIVNAIYTATQPLTTEFKVDCETPGVALEYNCAEYTRAAFTVVGHGSDTPPTFAYPNGSRDEYIKNKLPSENSSAEYTNYNGSVTLGDESNHIGLEYNITARAKKGNFVSVPSYAVAYRTTVEITGLADGNVPNINDASWNNLDDTINNRKGVGIFIRGGDVLSGSNITQGLPTNWDTGDYEKTCLLTKDGTTYYFTTWGITKDYYFRVLAGLMDEKTRSDINGISQGPYGGIFAQNSWTSFYSMYPVPPGGYVQIQNTGTGGEGLLFEMGSKVQKYRD